MKNHDDIIRVAREAGIEFEPAEMLRGGTALFTDGAVSIMRMERFAAIVAAKEREACAQLCSADSLPYPQGMGSDGEFWEWGLASCATAIRARGAA